MRSLYSAASGMAAQQNRLDNIANNLANINTTGFKKSRESFQDLFYQELTVGGANSGQSQIQVGGGVRTAGMNRDNSAGSLTATGNPYDVAIQGDGFFVLQTPDGNPVYTRDGSFKLDGNGTLVSSSGLRLAGDISIPTDQVERMEILADGTVQAIFAGDNAFTAMGQIEVSSFVNPNGMRALGGNIFAQTPESGEPQPVDVNQVELRQGYLEGSNVDVAQELIEMIMAQRAFELNSKAVQAADETMQTAVNLRR